jgi:hypothetical protein
VSPIQEYEEYTKGRKGKAIRMMTWTNDVRGAWEEYYKGGCQ